MEEWATFTVPIEATKSSFDRLKPDQHLRGDYIFRLRRLSFGSIVNGDFEWAPQKAFHQGTDINKYAGGLDRQYEPLEDETRRVVQGCLIPEIQARLPQGNYEVNVHQTRIVSDDEHIGIVVPEGLHHDGVDFVSICGVHRENVNGGVTCLLRSENADCAEFEMVLETGEALLFNDRDLLHYTTYITPKLPERTTYRDAFVTLVARAN